MEQQAVAEEKYAAYKYKADKQQWGNQQNQDETSQQLHRGNNQRAHLYNLNRNIVALHALPLHYNILWKYKCMELQN